MGIGSTEKGKLGELYVFSKLIEMGAMPFVPTADVKGIDAIVRKVDGTYIEIQIKTTWPPEQAGYFDVSGLVERENLFIVGVIMGLEKPETWILPSMIFIKNATVREKGTVHLLSLGLGETKLEKSRREELAEYREAWHLLTGNPKGKPQASSGRRSNMKCHSCHHEMDKNLHCLIAQPSEIIDKHLAEYFKGYRTELWKCPQCGHHKIFIYRNDYPHFDVPLGKLR